MNEMNLKTKAIIFDMDGVILDSESICDIAWEIVCKNLNLPDGNSIIQECRGTNKTDSCEIIKKHYGQDFDAVHFLELSSIEFKKIENSKGIPLMPYAKEALDYLSKKYPLALASSTRSETVNRQLGNLNLLSYFKTFTCGDMVVHSKPNPEIYLLSCKSLNLKPEECIAIEDSPNGVKSAYAAGIPVIMIPDKIQPTDEIKKLCWKILPSLKEIKDVL